MPVCTVNSLAGICREEKMHPGYVREAAFFATGCTRFVSTVRLLQYSLVFIFRVGEKARNTYIIHFDGICIK